MAVSAKKVQAAIEVLKAGGSFQYYRAPGYFYNQMIFKWGLFNKNGFKVKGFAGEAFYAVKEVAKLEKHNNPGFSERYFLVEEGVGA